MKMICMEQEHEHISQDEATVCANPHAHVWNYGETEDSPIYCMECRADGLA